MNKNANQFVSFKFGDVRLLDILQFLRRATSLNSFLKAFTTSETNGYFPWEWINDIEKLNITQLPPYETFFSKLNNNNTLQKDYSDFQCSIDARLTSKEALSKLKLKQPPATGQETYQNLTSFLQQENMRSLKDFLLKYNNNDVVPTLEAMQKVIDFYTKKGTDIAKLGCTLSNLGKICLHKSTTANNYPFTGSDKNLVEKLREDMVGGIFLIFTRKADL